MKTEIEMNSEVMEDLLNNIHDYYYDLTGESINQYKALLLASKVPSSILLEASQWGGGDTEVRERMGKWMRENLKELTHKIESEDKSTK